MKKYSEEIKNFIAANYKGVGPKDMAELLNQTFGTEYKHSQLKGYYANHKLNSGLDGRFLKGHVPANKGKKKCWRLGTDSVQERQQAG